MHCTSYTTHLCFQSRNVVQISDNGLENGSSARAWNKNLSRKRSASQKDSICSDTFPPKCVIILCIRYSPFELTGVQCQRGVLLGGSPVGGNKIHGGRKEVVGEEEVQLGRVEGWKLCTNTVPVHL